MTINYYKNAKNKNYRFSDYLVELIVSWLSRKTGMEYDFT